MNKKTYANKLKDPRWQKKRLEIMDRDNWRCQACGSTSKTLSVHHFKYQGEPWEADNEDLQTLCTSCHKALGEHPRGGIMWVNDEYGVGVHYADYCPVCGSKDMKDCGSFDKCMGCGNRIGFIEVPDAE